VPRLFSISRTSQCPLAASARINAARGAWRRGIFINALRAVARKELRRRTASGCVGRGRWTRARRAWAVASVWWRACYKRLFINNIYKHPEKSSFVPAHMFENPRKSDIRALKISSANYGFNLATRFQHSPLFHFAFSILTSRQPPSFSSEVWSWGFHIIFYLSPSAILFLFPWDFEIVFLWAFVNVCVNVGTSHQYVVGYLDDRYDCGKTFRGNWCHPRQSLYWELLNSKAGCCDCCSWCVK